MNAVCQSCKRARATVHIMDNFPQKRERHLCEDCAAQEGVIIKQTKTTNDILQEFIKHKVGLGESKDVACPTCGTTFHEFQVKGLLGCPEDYSVFAKLLTPLIERAHEGGIQHVGKVPKKAGASVRKKTGLLRLNRELEDAIVKEDYEQAARVRDQIRKLESV